MRSAQAAWFIHPCSRQFLSFLRKQESMRRHGTLVVCMDACHRVLIPSEAHKIFFSVKLRANSVHSVST